MENYIKIEKLVKLQNYYNKYKQNIQLQRNLKKEYVQSTRKVMVDMFFIYNLIRNC